jgi:hypothetical protein
MTWLTRLVACALVAVLVLLGAVVLTYPNLGAPGRWPRGSATPYRTLAEEAQRLEKMQQERREIDASVRQRDEVVGAVIEGRCSLLEAAARFWELNRSLSGFQWDNFRRYYPGATDGERCCRHVIRHVYCRLMDDPDPRDRVVRRLEAELAECLRRGPIRLPGEEGAPPGR